VIRLVSVFLIAFAASGQPCASPTPIQITGPVYGLAGPMNGTITLQLGYSISGPPLTAQSQFQLQVTSGTLSAVGVSAVCLPASAVITANYAVTNANPLTGSTKFTRYWFIPPMGGPYTVNAVECTQGTLGCGSVTYLFLPSWGSMTPAVWGALTPSQWGNLHP
jgi:hypothetical protein